MVGAPARHHGVPSAGTRMTFRRTAAVAATLCLATSAAALAHSGATGIVKQRMEAMKDMAAAMKSLGEMTRGKATFDTAEATAAAGRIAAHAGEAPNLFPDGSFQMPSEARARIAEERDRFAGLAGDLRRAAGAMQAAARAKDAKALAAARRDAGQACSGCHKIYREKKRHH
ncbi:MAG: hypothetical protein GEU92_05975 [Alphaproteobacteria bacterium]|nr:hypothetical protein [Alphaproteobacteria bacterium]